MKTRLIILIVFTALTGAACSTGLSELRAEGGDPIITGQPTDPTESPGQSTRPTTDVNQRPYQETVDLSIADIQAFWTAEMPGTYGRDFVPIPADEIYAYGRSTPPPACGNGPQPSPEELLGNAFYCTEGDFIAFDDETLFPDLYESYGSYAVAMVLAHEWGHAAQDQMGLSSGRVRTVDLEQQADCFAGAWTKWVGDGESASLNLSAGSLDAALGGMLEFRDAPGTNPNDPAAHGSGFDRVRAFRDGFTSGIDACAEYESNPPQIMQLPFTEDEYVSGGNLPYLDLIELLVPDFDGWIASEFPSFTPLSGADGYDPATEGVTCGDTSLSGEDANGKIFYCSSDNSIRWDEPWLAGINDDSGDFATGLLLGMQYGVALQAQNGADDGAIASEEGIQQRACLVGAYSGSLVDERQRPTLDTNGEPVRQLSISGGDLDEALASLISFTSADDVGESGSSLAFDRIEAFQNGVLEGTSACGF